CLPFILRIHSQAVIVELVVGDRREVLCDVTSIGQRAVHEVGDAKNVEDTREVLRRREVCEVFAPEIDSELQAVAALDPREVIDNLILTDLTALDITAVFTSHAGERAIEARAVISSQVTAAHLGGKYRF